MGAIQFTDRGTSVRVRDETRTLTQAAVAALPAPSIFNSQPWRWRISDEGAQLRADRARQLRSVDPDGRMLTVSCGIALHHALTALAAKGAVVVVERLPDPGDPDLLARLRVTGARRPDAAALRLHAVMAVRRTDRRPFADLPVPREQLDRLRASAEAGGVHLHLLRADEVIDLTAVAGRAAATEIGDPAYRADLERWTHRDLSSGDGIGAVLRVGDGTPTARPVPLRDFTGTAEAPTGRPSLADRAARYAVLFTDGDGPEDWLAAGEALSSVLLNAAEQGLAASPMSDLVEVPFARWRLRNLLSGIGHPVIVVRFGVPADRQPAPATPRRPATEIIELFEDGATAAPVDAAP
jgi:nitroreductase